MAIIAVEVQNERCEACMSGDHDDHRVSQVFDGGMYAGDRIECRCLHNRRRYHEQRQSLLVIGSLLIMLGVAAQLGLWFMLYG